MTESHYYATCVYGWATAPTRQEAIDNLIRRYRRDLKPLVKQGQRRGDPGAYLWTCRVNAPADAEYQIRFFQPVDVHCADAIEFYITHLTDREVATYSVPTNQQEA